MKLSTELFGLIKSLTKSEKRYFKLFASLQGGEKNYIKLFDELETLDEYNESAIREKFKNEKFIKQLPFTKNYLYRLIMKSLLSFHSEKSLDLKLCDIIQNCKIFYARGMYKEFFSNIRTGKRLAEKTERFNFQLQFIEMEKVVFFKKVIKYKDESEILRQEEEVKRITENYNAYSNLIVETVNFFRLHGRIRDDSLTDFVNTKLNHELMRTPQNALSVMAKEAYYRELMHLSDLLGDFEKMKQYCLKRFEIIQNNPLQFEDRLFNYNGDILIYLILLNIRLKNFREANKFIRVAEKFYSKGTIDENDFFIIKNYGLLQIFFKQRKYKKAAELIPEILGSLRSRKNNFDNNFRILLFFTMVNVLVLSDETEQALNFNNELLNDEIIKIRQDIKYYAELVNILIHYELGNHTLVKHLINSKFRYLEKAKRPFKMETILLGFIKKLPSFKNEIEKLDKMIDIKRELEILRNDKYEKNVFDYFPFDEWIEKQMKFLQEGISK
ncbi:MAG: hypothetical protein OZ913_00080 [Ignavibacteriaceae bacterium]|jgi:hypothetical protein|nr:MAG: hypothetical protein UZ04_CHB001000868 [Chlorobi bacterium OLB4]MBW7855675.1 hypothetical protein [Ignavibacteria bacterium]MEB2328682.1 hypothetical protein [Ignavibacteriaceae bacterium]OQY78598.1 MAG: hypothetical protein B6D43_02025 [Ignavibacteriales bacterium UTCHB1]